MPFVYQSNAMPFCCSALHCRHVMCRDDPQSADDSTWQNQRQKFGTQGSKGGVVVQGCMGEFRGGQGPGEQAAADDGRWQPARILEQARPLQAQEVCSQTLLHHIFIIYCLIKKEFAMHSPVISALCAARSVYTTISAALAVQNF